MGGLWGFGRFTVRGLLGILLLLGCRRLASGVFSFQSRSHRNRGLGGPHLKHCFLGNTDAGPRNTKTLGPSPKPSTMKNKADMGQATTQACWQALPGLGFQGFRV